jgi:hypothetical protein
MKIRLATSNDQQQVMNVLNKTTLGLQKKGIYQSDYPWDVNKFAREIKNNYTYVLSLDEEIVGTFCIKDIDSLSELTFDSKSYYLSQIAILPEYQGMAQKLPTLLVLMQRKKIKRFIWIVGLEMKS